MAAQKQKLSREQRCTQTKERNSRRRAAALTTASYRQLHRDNRTNTEQIKELDIRLGKGIGAKRERQRLAKQQ